MNKFHSVGEWRDTRKPRSFQGNEAWRGGRTGREENRDTQTITVNDSRKGGGDLVDLSVVVQVQPCCKGKISCRFVDNGVMAEVCLDASSLMRRAYIQETRCSGSDAVERKKGRERVTSGLYKLVKCHDRRIREGSTSFWSKKCDAKGGRFKERKCRGEFNASTLRGGVIVLAQPKYRCKNI